VKRPAPDARLGAWAEAVPLKSSRPFRAVSEFVRKTLAIAETEARKLRHDPTEMVTRAVQPALWLLVFGQVFARARAIPTGGIGYMDFMAPGILAQSVLFVAIFSGMAIIWERDLGIVHKFLASPTPRTALVAGKSLAAGVRSLTQAFVVYGLAAALGVRMSWSAGSLLGVFAALILGSALFSTFSLIIACVVKTRERFMGIGQVLTMPLFFASNALYPVSMMPGWLQAITRLNPLTYEVDALRALMLPEAASSYGLALDYTVLGVTAVGLVMLGGRLYPRVVH
jgi:ABC-2 type transport system permease protein